MTSTTAHEFSEHQWPIEPSADARMRVAELQKPSFKKRAARYLTRFLIIFGMGVATTLAWQSRGDEIRAMIANSSPQLGWLAPQAALAGTAPEAAPIGSATASPESQQLEVMSISLVAMQQSIDQLTPLVSSKRRVRSPS